LYEIIWSTIRSLSNEISDFESKVHYIGSLYFKQETINQSMCLNYRHNSNDKFPYYFQLVAQEWCTFTIEKNQELSKKCQKYRFSNLVQE